jgi:hypothetical protein
MFVADLPTDGLSVGSEVVFTFYWAESDRWEGVDHVVRIAESLIGLHDRDK